jgi:hypothetical protein
MFEVEEQLESVGTKHGTDVKTAATVEALVQLLRGRPYDEIRKRMYDNPPGSPWWTACKIELEIRNAERTASSSTETSRVLDKMKVCTEQLNTSTDKFHQATQEMTSLLKGTNDSFRRMEIATYIIIANTIVQLFYISFYFFVHR